jgi:hypothetical protein
VETSVPLPKRQIISPVSGGSYHRQRIYAVLGHSLQLWTFENAISTTRFDE